jgi:Ca2+-binding RTX toxin-like protein
VTNVRGYGHHATIKGVADANGQVDVYDGATQVGTATADASGNWTFKSDCLSDAVHTFTAKAVDSAGTVVATSEGAAIVGSCSANTLTGTAGDDVLVGRGSADTFVFAQDFGQDVIKDFRASGANHDTIEFSKSTFADFDSMLANAQQVGHDVVITSGTDSLTLKHTNVSSLSAQDFQFA